VSIKAGRPTEAVLKQTLNPFLLFSEGEDAVSNIARREHIQFSSQAA